MQGVRWDGGFVQLTWPGLCAALPALLSMRPLPRLCCASGRGLEPGLGGGGTLSVTGKRWGRGLAHVSAGVLPLSSQPGSCGAQVF